MCPLRSRPGGPAFAHGRRRFRHTLLLKLLLVLIAAGCLVNLLVGGFFRMAFARETHASLERNVIHYAGYLAGDIGSPPDTAKARVLARAYGLSVRVDGPGGTWESDPGMDFPERAFRRSVADGGAGWYRGCFLVRVEKGGTRYYFAADAHHMADGRWQYLALLILLLSLVLMGAFMAMRRVLFPLRFLTAAVERLGRGELGHQVPIFRGRDELGELARAFNAMSTRLKEMVRSREQLLLDASHELRSPLTRLKVALEMAPDGMAKESMRGDLSEMEAMIAEILEAARLDSANGRLNLEDTDLRALVSEIARLFQGRPPGLRVQSADAGAGPRARVDRERVKKVFANVLDNALKYSQDQARPVEVDFAEGNGEVTLRIRDYGVGIPEEEIPKLFEPFYRVDRSRSRDTGGYGLGLSLCKRIMEAHGGRIAISSLAGLSGGAAGKALSGAEVSLVFPSSGPA
jgi:signal transduction histidine kinase